METGGVSSNKNEETNVIRNKDGYDQEDIDIIPGKVDSVA